MFQNPDNNSAQQGIKTPQNTNMSFPYPFFSVITEYEANEMFVYLLREIFSASIYKQRNWTFANPPITAIDF